MQERIPILGIVDLGTTLVELHDQLMRRPGEADAPGDAPSHP